MRSELSSRMLTYFRLYDRVIDTYEQLCSLFQPLTAQDLDRLKRVIAQNDQHLAEEIPWGLIKLRIANNIIDIRGLRLSGSIPCFFILYPVNKETSRLIASGELASSGAFTANHICDYDSAESIYISWVYGSTAISKAFILWMLQSEIARIQTQYPTIKHFFTRPATEKGYAVVKNNGFSLLHRENGIFSK